MRFKQTGNKKDVVAVTVHNDEATLVIKAGAPVFLSADGTEDGLAVKSAVSLAVAKQTFFFGIALRDMNPGDYGECQVFGFMDYARVATASRAASTDVWASYPAGVLGDILGPVTGTGHAASQGDQAFSRIGAASSLQLAAGYIALGEAFASSTTQASSLGGSSTIWVTTKKVFVRAM